MVSDIYRYSLFPRMQRECADGWLQRCLDGGITPSDSTKESRWNSCEMKSALFRWIYEFNFTRIWWCKLSISRDWEMFSKYFLKSGEQSCCRGLHAIPAATLCHMNLHRNRKSKPHDCSRLWAVWTFIELALLSTDENFKAQLGVKLFKSENGSERAIVFPDTW